jgi:hypothetical protein
MRTFDDLRLFVDEFADLDLDENDRDARINEGYAELCIRSEWSLARKEFGPVAQGVELYALGDDVARIRSVRRNGRLLQEISEDTRDAIVSGQAVVTPTDGCYYISSDENAVRQLGLYPAPQRDDTISARIVRRPSPMLDATDVPDVPYEFRGAIAAYAASKVYAYSEDDPQLADRANEEFEVGVRRLAQARRKFNRSGPFLIKQM